MKTQDFAAALTAFAGLAEPERARSLQQFADIFRSGKQETVAARLKKLSPAPRHPATLKASLESIRAGLIAAGATKQASDVGIVLSVFCGTGDATADAFLEQIVVAPPARKRAAKPPPEPDHALATELADTLSSVVLDTAAFNEVVKRLRVAKFVNTPTLAIVANRFLGKSRDYKGRKDAIDDIVARQKFDVREHARGRTLNRLGV